jgi:probable aminopeptidase NPEPL1
MFRFPSQSLVMRCTSLLLLTRSSAFHQHSFVRAARSHSSTQLYASSATLTFGTSLDKLEGADYNATMVIGRKESIQQAMPSMMETLGLNIAQPVQASMMDAVKEKTGGSSSSIVPKGDTAHTFAICGLPTKVSRNNHPMAVHTLTKYIGTVPSKGNTRVVIVTDSNIAPLASAAAKAFPLFTMKSKATNPEERKVHVVFMRSDGTVVDTNEELKAAQAVASGVQLAARLVDSHPELLTTTRFAKEVEKIVQEHPEIKMTQIIGEDLRAYGGLYGVGKAANCPPRMIILEYDGQGEETVALVGKGIVYDTGGLSLKTKTGMCGMKHDMGGAAGVLGGFYSAVKLGVKKKVYCILCLAENAIGPDAFRNDDILTMYSGKTVEVNNCDAEGRLVLADGVAHATKHFENLDLVVDMATLTGSQLVATGKKHAGILANTEALEKRAMEAGMHSGDLCFPLLYAPELLMDEFKSEVADMRNRVKDRSNAQTSCAGHFIEAHLKEGYQGGWLHVDMAGPGTLGQRGTGYGVGLVLSLLEAPGF